MMSPSARVLVSTQPIDVRKGHDGLAALVPSVLRKAPFLPTVSAWHSPRRALFCVLLAPRGQVEAALLGEPLSRHWSERHWRKTGLLMACKRLEDATFTWPAITDGMMTLPHAQFEALFAGLD